MASVIYGTRGSGKSTLGRKLAEEVVNQGQRFCAIDPTGAFWGLKSTESGTDVGLPVIIFGGDHADVPLEPDAGSQIADVVAEIDQSTILDLEHLSKGKQIRFLGGFLTRLYHINREPLLLLMDEAQRYAPQKPMGPDAQITLGAAEDIVKLGRKHGIGPVVFTQRGSGLNKEVSELADVLIAFRTPGVLDQGRIKDWLEANATAEQMKTVMSTISGLPTGTAIFASNHPDLKLFGPYAIDMPRSFDSSSTPKVGQRRREPKVLYEPDLEVLRGRMTSAIERAKAEDPKELRKRIATLERELASRPPETVEVEKIVEKVVEVPTIPGKISQGLQDLYDAYEEVDRRMAYLREAHKIIDGKTTAEAALRRLTTTQLKQVFERQVGKKVTSRPNEGEFVRVGDRPLMAKAPIATYDDVQVSKAERAFLTALAQFPDGRTKAQAAFLAGYSPSVSTTRNTLSALRTKGLISGWGTNGAPLVITEHGLAALGDWEPAPTGEALIHFWYGKLSKAQVSFLRAVVDSHPEPVTKERAAELAGYDPGVSTTRNTLSSLRTLGLIEGYSEIRVADALVGA